MLLRHLFMATEMSEEGAVFPRPPSVLFPAALAVLFAVGGGILTCIFAEDFAEMELIGISYGHTHLADG